MFAHLIKKNVVVMGALICKKMSKSKRFITKSVVAYDHMIWHTDACSYMSVDCVHKPNVDQGQGSVYPANVSENVN